LITPIINQVFIFGLTSINTFLLLIKELIFPELKKTKKPTALLTFWQSAFLFSLNYIPRLFCAALTLQNTRLKPQRSFPAGD
jgi:hypothetical protein